MYVKRVKKSGAKDRRKSYEYLHLVDSVRTEKGPRQRLLLNLGALPLKEGEHKIFAKEVAREISGQEPLVRPRVNKRLKGCIRQTVTRLLEKQGKEVPEPDKKELMKGRTVEAVDTQSIKTHSHHSIGAEHVCHEIYKELEIGEFLKAQGVNEKTRNIIEGLVVSRLISPGSERHTKKHLETNSGLYELIGQEEKNLSLNAYYRVQDVLSEHKEGLETHLEDRENGLFELKNKVVLYDLTNTYIEGRGSKNDRAKYGRSKEKRSDCLLMTLGLAITDGGFVKRSQMFSGNQGETKTLKKILTSLGAQKSNLVVMDAGIASQENLDYLRREGFHYLVCSRKKADAPGALKYDPIKTYSDGSQIEIASVKTSTETILHCKSDRKAHTVKQIRSRSHQLLLEQLQSLKDGLIEPRKMKRYDKVLERIGRLKEKYSAVAKRYTISVEQNNDLAADIRWTLKEAKPQDQNGFYQLKTSDLSLKDTDIWHTYRMLNQVEDSFRYMKSHLGMRPIFHQKTDTAETHLFISVLAYRLWNCISFKLRKKRDNRSWPSIKQELSSHVRYTLQYDVSHEDSFTPCFLRQSSEPTEEQLFIYRSLGISSLPIPDKLLSGLF